MDPNLLDPRSLRLFRIAVGLLILASMWQRVAEFHLFYGEDGAVPAGMLHIIYGVGYPSLPSEQTVWAITICLGALSGSALVLGYSVPVASATALLSLSLLHARNSLIEYGADRVLRFEALSVFLVFVCRQLILCRCLPGKALILLVQRTLVAQLLYVHLGTALSRDEGAWWWRASALREALFDGFEGTLARSAGINPFQVRFD